MTIKAAVDARKKERDGLKARIAFLEPNLQDAERKHSEIVAENIRLRGALGPCLKIAEQYSIMIRVLMPDASLLATDEAIADARAALEGCDA